MRALRIRLRLHALAQIHESLQRARRHAPRKTQTLHARHMRVLVEGLRFSVRKICFVLLRTEQKFKQTSNARGCALQVTRVLAHRCITQRCTRSGARPRFNLSRRHAGYFLRAATYSQMHATLTPPRFTQDQLYMQRLEPSAARGLSQKQTFI